MKNWFDLFFFLPAFTTGLIRYEWLDDPSGASGSSPITTSASHDSIWPSRQFILFSVGSFHSWVITWLPLSTGSMFLSSNEYLPPPSFGLSSPLSGVFETILSLNWWRKEMSPNSLSGLRLGLYLTGDTWLGLSSSFCTLSKLLFSFVTGILAL